MGQTVVDARGRSAKSSRWSVDAVPVGLPVAWVLKSAAATFFSSRLDAFFTFDLRHGQEPKGFGIAVAAIYAPLRFITLNDKNIPSKPGFSVIVTFFASATRVTIQAAIAVLNLAVARGVIVDGLRLPVPPERD